MKTPPTRAADPAPAGQLTLRGSRSTGYAIPRTALTRAVADRITVERHRRGLTQAQLCDRLATLGWPLRQNTLSCLERGVRRLNIDQLALLAAALGVPADVLLVAPTRAQLLAAIR